MRLLWTFVALTSSLASASYHEYARSSAPAVLVVSTEMPAAPSADAGAGAYLASAPTPIAPAVPSAPESISPVVDQELVVIEFVPTAIQPTIAVDPVPPSINSVDETAEKSEPCSEETAHPSPMPSAPGPSGPAFTATMPAPPSAHSGIAPSVPAPSVPEPSVPAPSVRAPDAPSADSSIEGSSETASEAGATPCPEEGRQYQQVSAPSAPEPSAPAPSEIAPSVPQPSVAEPSAPAPPSLVPSAPAPSYTAPPPPTVPSTPQPSVPHPSAPQPSAPQPSAPQPSAPTTPPAPEPSAPAPAVPEPSSIEGSSEAPSEHEVTSCVEETIATPATVSGLAPEVPAAETPMSSASLESKTPGPFVAATTIFIDVTTDIVVTEILTATGLPRPAVPTNSASTVPQLPEATTPPPVDVSIMERPTTISTSVDASSSATSTSSAPTSLAEACVPAAVSTVTVAIPVYLPFYPPFATEVWPNYSAIQPPFAPGPVIWTQGPIVPAPTEMVTVVPPQSPQSSSPCTTA